VGVEEEVRRAVVRSFKPRELLKVGNRSYVNAFRYPESRFDPDDPAIGQILTDPGKLFTDKYVIPPSSLIFKWAGRIYDKKWWGQLAGGVTDALTVMQGAVDDLPPEGGRVFVKGGAYDIVALLDGPQYGAIKLRSGLMLEGAGYSTVLQAAGINGRIIEARDKSNITLTYLRLRSTEPALSGVNETGGMIFKGCSHVRLTNLCLENFNRGPLDFYPRDYPAAGWEASPPSHSIFIDKLTYTGPDYRANGPCFSYRTYDVAYTNSFIHSRDDSLCIVGGCHGFHMSNVRLTSEIGVPLHFEVVGWDVWDILAEDCYFNAKGSGAYRAVFGDRLEAGLYLRDSSFSGCNIYNDYGGNHGYNLRNALRVDIAGGNVGHVGNGVLLEVDCSRVTVDGVEFYDCNAGGVDLTVVKVSGVRMVDAFDCIVSGCSFMQGTYPMYAVSEEGTSDYNIISGSNARGTAGISTVGVNTITPDNIT